MKAHNSRFLRKIPSAAFLIFLIILLAMICTWIIPGGTYEEIVDPLTGISSINANSYISTDHVSVMPWQIPLILVQSAIKSISIILLIISGTFMVICCSETGMFDAIIASLCRRFEGKESALIVLVTITFSLFGFIVPPQCFIAFTGTIILLTISIGYDAIVGLSIVMLGTACSAISGPINSITAICQNLVGLPIYSGIGVRFIAFAILLSVTIIHTLIYGKRIKNDPTKSFMHGIGNPTADYQDHAKTSRAINLTDWINLAVVVAVFTVIVIGCTFWGWGTNEISAMMISCGIIVSVFSRTDFQSVIKHANKSVTSVAGMIIIIVMANAIGLILTEGMIVSTIIHALSSALSILPDFLIPFGVMTLISILNVIIPSGSAKAVMLMPVLAPIGQIVGMSAQTTVLAYTFGDGFSNFIIPHDSCNISYLEAAKIPYPVWVKFMFRLFLWWCLTGTVILTALYYIGYGPF